MGVTIVIQNLVIFALANLHVNYKKVRKNIM